MLARWFDRSGIGQFLAPDERIAQQPPPDEARSEIWQILAPDPNFAPPKESPPPTTLGQVQCQRCGEWTPNGIDGINEIQNTPAKRIVETPFMTPSPSQQFRSIPSALTQHVESLVVSAATETARATFSPPFLQKLRDKVFRLCATVRMDDKLAKRLRALLVKDPSLLHARATHLGQLVPDGMTPLMAAAYAGSCMAAEVLLQVAKEMNDSVVMDCDLQGRTALHIAAEYGNMYLVQLLLPSYQLGDSTTGGGATTANNSTLGSPMPIDLLGRTPLGRAITSPIPTARKRRKELESLLFSPGDLSVFGFAKPETERTFQQDDLRLAFGIADMPGMRVTMEDAVCTSTFSIDGIPYCLLGVCDGHGDQGRVAQFVAEQIPQVLQTQLHIDPKDWTTIWKNTCFQVDEKLRQAEITGGSTAVFALITSDLIVVANVGDSRAILIQSPNTLEESMQQLSLEQSPHATVIPLSDDHKPNLPQEQSRIEAAGMKVVPVTFQEDGNDITIHKVAKTETDMLAVSRAFGDFEYKENITLSMEDQAITAVPDVIIHTRNPELDLFMILACDGVWDVCDNPMVQEFVMQQYHVRKQISTDTILPEIGDALLRESLNRGSKDNMTTIIAALEAIPSPTGKTLDFSSPSNK